MIKRNLVTSLLLYETVRTTKKRAQVVRPMADRLITVAKTKQPHLAIRFINRVVTDKNASRKLMEVLRERYSDRQSGFTRMIPVGARKGDGAELVEISLLEGKDVVPREAKAPRSTVKKSVKTAKSKAKKDSSSAS